MYKGLQAVKHNSQVMLDKQGHHHLGLGINMFKSMKYWLQATALVRLSEEKSLHSRSFELTNLGDLIVNKDPYFENISTLWLLQIELASNKQIATTWYWLFNEFLPREFNEDRLVESLEQYALSQGNLTTAQSSFKKDARCLLRTYLPSAAQSKGVPLGDTFDSPLASLDLIRNGSFPGFYRFHVGKPQSMPLEIFEYAMYRFRENASSHGSVTTLDDLRWAPFSPGRILGLDMPTILEFIEELETTTSSIQLTRTADLNLVTIDESKSSFSIISDYYSRYEEHFV
jgi:hypothetical protein